MFTGRDACLNGFRPFNSDSLWNENISSASVDPNSNNIIHYIGLSTTLHPDFGSGTYEGSTIGIPYEIADTSQSLVNIDITGYSDESDPGPAAVPENALIEGYPNPDDGDRHVLVLEKGGCWLYELYGAQKNSNGTWQAASAALWDLLGNETRPYTWTSADAPGFPFSPDSRAMTRSSSAPFGMRFATHCRRRVRPSCSPQRTGRRA